MALSATVGKPEQVTQWLQSVKALQQEQDTQLGIAAHLSTYQVKLIQHAERYADLRYYTFKPSLVRQQEDEDSLEAATAPAPASSTPTDVFSKIHPCAVLTPEQLQDSGFPSEISLEPCDCLQLFKAMHGVCHAAASTSNNASDQGDKLPPALGPSKSVAMTVQEEAGHMAQLTSDPAPPAAAAVSNSAPTDFSINHKSWHTATQAALLRLSPAVYFPGGKPAQRCEYGRKP